MILFPEAQYSINVQLVTTLGASVLIGRLLRTINLSPREVEAPTEFHQSARLVAATLRSAVLIWFSQTRTAWALQALHRRETLWVVSGVLDWKCGFCKKPSFFWVDPKSFCLVWLILRGWLFCSANIWCYLLPFPTHFLRLACVKNVSISLSMFNRIWSQDWILVAGSAPINFFWYFSSWIFRPQNVWTWMPSGVESYAGQWSQQAQVFAN